MLKKLKPIGVYRKCDWVTMTGTASAITGILLASNGKTTYAVFCLIFSAICDAFDGVVARKFGSLKDYEVYGIELDSLNDAIAFGVLPMMIVQNLSTRNIYLFIISVFFCIAGVIRLAYFNMLSTLKKGDSKEFIGMPITCSAIIIPLVYFLTFIVAKEYRNVIFPVTLLITGILFITPIKLKKLSTREKAALSLIGIITIIITIIKIW